MVHMQAIRLHEVGPATNLTLDELPDLDPGEWQRRVLGKAVLVVQR